MQYYNYNIKTIPSSENMIWAGLDNKFIYLTYDDYKKCKITSETIEFSFEMRIHPDRIKSREDIKYLVGL